MLATLHQMACGHDYLLNERHLSASLQVRGAAAQAARLWARLERGEPVRIGVLGASVAMSGGCQREHQPHIRCADFDGLSYEKRWAYGGRAKGRVRGFVMQVLDWINATWPHAEHRVFNGASDGNPAAVLERCMLSALPADVDLVLLEFGSARSDPYSVERIIRRLLRLPGRPMLVLVNVREWCRCGALVSGQSSRTVGSSAHPTTISLSLSSNSTQPRLCSASGHDVRAVTRMFARWDGPEDDFAALCRHYSQTCVSLRDGLFRDIMRDAPGFSVMEVAADCVHPSRGSKGHRYLGDVVVHALQSSWETHRQSRGINPAPLATQAAVVTRAVLPPPLHEVNSACNSDAQPAWRCYSFEVSPSSRLQNDRVLTGRFEPEPSEPGGASPASACATLAECVLHRASQTAVEPACVRSLGHWQFCPRAFNAMRARKPGLIAFRAGASMRVHVDARGLRDALVSVAHLTSYEQMGIAQVTCEGGCTCAPQWIDAHVTDPSRNVSIVRESVFRVTPSEVATDCVLRFTVADASSSGGGHKWKLLRVALGASTSTVVTKDTVSSSCAGRQPHYRGWVNMRAKRRGGHT